MASTIRLSDCGPLGALYDEHCGEAHPKVGGERQHVRFVDADAADAGQGSGDLRHIILLDALLDEFGPLALE